MPPGEEQCGHRCHEHADTGAKCAEPEIVLQLRVVGFHREVHRRQVGAERQGQRPDGERKWLQPWVHKRLDERAGWARRDAAGRDGARRHAEQHRGHQAGPGKEHAPAALHVIALAVIGAEGERRPAQHDADQHERKRDVQRHRESRVRRREAHEEQDHREDQPYMVGFPDRPDGIGDERALSLPAWPGGEQVPHAAAEVGAGHDEVGGERHHDASGDEQRRRDLRHRAAPACRSAASPRRSGSSRSGGT